MAIVKGYGEKNKWPIMEYNNHELKRVGTLIKNKKYKLDELKEEIKKLEILQAYFVDQSKKSGFINLYEPALRDNPYRKKSISDIKIND